MSKSTIKQWYTKGKDRGSNTHTHAALSRPRSNFLPSSSLDLWAQTESGAALHFKSPPLARLTHCQIKGGREGRNYKYRQFPTNGGSKQRGARRLLCVAHHTVSDEVLVVSRAWSRERALRRLKRFPDYKAGPARGPIWARGAGATTSHQDKRPSNYRSSTGSFVSGRVWYCDREKPPHPMKASSEKATSTGVSSSNEELLWLPNGENGCHAWRASHHATTTNQIGGIKKRGVGRTAATHWWAAG